MFCVLYIVNCLIEENPISGTYALCNMSSRPSKNGSKSGFNKFMLTL